MFLVESYSDVFPFTGL